MLILRGKLVSFTERRFVGRKDHKEYTFYTGYFVGGQGSKPMEVELGTDASRFEVGSDYELEVYVKLYEVKNDAGNVIKWGYQFMLPKKGVFNVLPDDAGAKAAA